MKKISIITPVYKGNIYLNKLLENIEDVSKKVPNYLIEWVLVNDSPQIPLISLNSNIHNLKIKIINNSKNIGIHRSRINGFFHSSGDLIMFLDQDDYLFNNSLEIHLRNIEKADVSITNGYRENKNGKKTSIFQTLFQMDVIKKIQYYFYLENFIVSPGMALIRRKSIPKEWLNNFLKINGADDWLLWVLMLSKDRSFHISLLPTYIHRQNNNNTSNNALYMNESLKEAIQLFNKITHKKYKKWVKVGQRRAIFKYELEVKNKNIYILYLLNPDIAFYNFKLKIKRHLGRKKIPYFIN